MNGDVGGYGGGGDSGHSGDASQDYGITYEIHERTMPGFYPLLRIEIGL